MNLELIELIEDMNPWLQGENKSIPLEASYLAREQTERLLLPEWDPLWLILVGPRQSGKTTLGKYLAREWIRQGRFKQLLYLNCDFEEIRQWIRSPRFIKESIDQFKLESPIIFLDEVQRLQDPGLLLKGIVDLRLPIKLMASGSSQLEMKSRVQEYLTGRHLEARVLPFSYQEIGHYDEKALIYGCYPQVFFSQQKEMLLRQLYEDYISKDIIEILKIGKPDIMQKLVGLLAHSSGQLVNYQQLATDCRVSIPTVQHYCSVLEQTYTVCKLKPFVGNKRKEIVSNPIYYFVDNGFRNQALRRFSLIDERSDRGLLVESAVFQEILKYREQHFFDFDIHFWRTQSGAEVDFVLFKTEGELLPIEVKHRRLNKPVVTRSLRSFLAAYEPSSAVVISKNFVATTQVGKTKIHFIPFEKLFDLYPLIQESLNLC